MVIDSVFNLKSKNYMDSESKSQRWSRSTKTLPWIDLISKVRTQNVRNCRKIKFSLQCQRLSKRCLNRSVFNHSKSKAQPSLNRSTHTPFFALIPQNWPSLQKHVLDVQILQKSTLLNLLWSVCFTDYPRRIQAFVDPIQKYYRVSLELTFRVLMNRSRLL